MSLFLFVLIDVCCMKQVRFHLSPTHPFLIHPISWVNIKTKLGFHKLPHCLLTNHGVTGCMWTRVLPVSTISFLCIHIHYKRRLLILARQMTCRLVWTAFLHHIIFTSSPFSPVTHLFTSVHRCVTVISVISAHQSVKNTCMNEKDLFYKPFYNSFLCGDKMFYYCTAQFHIFLEAAQRPVWLVN